MKQYDLLGKEETNELILKAKEGDKAALSTLTNANIGLIQMVASKMQNSSLPFEDMVQEGFFGLAKAIEKFDPSKGFRFSTYATWWIRQSIQRAISNNGRLIRIPVYVQEDLYRITKAQQLLEQKFNRTPTIEEVVEAIKMDMSWYDKICSHANFSTLVEMLMDEKAKVTSPKITDAMSAILEDLEFNDEAELIFQRMALYICKKKEIPSKEVVAARVNPSVKKVNEILSHKDNITSLEYSNDDSNVELGDTLVSEQNVEETYEQKMTQEGLIRAIDEVYGHQVKDVLEGIKKLEVQIAYLSKKVEKNINIDDEISTFEKNTELTVEEKATIKELLNKISSSKKTKSARLSVSVTDEIANLETLKAKLERKSLIPRDELIKKRFGLCGYEKQTLEQLGDAYGVSRERIRQIEKDILEGKTKESRLFREKLSLYCNVDKNSFI